MISDKTIQEVVKQIVLSANPRQVILFGSYARKEMRSDSDIDIMVLVNDTEINLKNISQALYKQVYDITHIPCDILVERESDFHERSILPTLERQILQEGHVLYAA